MYTYLQSLRAHHGEVFWTIIAYEGPTQCAYYQAIYELLTMDEPPIDGWLPEAVQRSMDARGESPTPEAQRGYDLAVFLSKLAVEEPLCPVITAEVRAAEILEEARYENNPFKPIDKYPHEDAGFSLGVSLISHGWLQENSDQVVADYGQAALLDKDDVLPIRTDSESYVSFSSLSDEALKSFGWFDKKVPEECPSWEKDLRRGMMEGVETYISLLQVVDDISDEKYVTLAAQAIFKSHDDINDTWSWDDDWGVPVG